MLFLMGAIYFFSSIPAETIPSFVGIIDILLKKGGHIVGYGFLAAALVRGLREDAGQAWLLAWLFAVLYGISDEVHQAFVPGRMSSWWDVGIDAVGALVGLVGWRIRKSGRLNDS